MPRRPSSEAHPPPPDVVYNEVITRGPNVERHASSDSPQSNEAYFHICLLPLALTYIVLSST